jgi:hypothetical protein
MRWLMLARNFFLLILPLMLSTETLGHGAESMARSNFETVGLGISIDEDCPLDKMAARKAAEAEFLRARIRIDDFMSIQDGGFWLDVNCIDKGNSRSYLYRVSIEWTWKQGAFWPLRVLQQNFGQVVDGADGLEEIIGKQVEGGLTQYLAANLK